jgi:phosphoribosylanthranilate isomerase
VKVKICGLTRYEDARLALDLGAWALGFIFHEPSPRHVTAERAAAILARLPAGTLGIGVFVDRPLDEVRATARAAGLRGIQLHGAEGPEFAGGLEGPAEGLQAFGEGAPTYEVIKAFRVGPRFDPAAVDAYPRCRILLDAFLEGVPGGTGKVCDWKTARAVQERRPIILAGGLGPGNAAEAAAEVRPEGLDVSSGVESRPGLKDPERLRSLFRALEPFLASGAARNG